MRAAPLVFALLLSSAPAAAGIDDLGGTKPGELEGGGHFDGDLACSLCHGGGWDGAESHLPHDSWAGTMMGNAARDPVFYAALAVANQDVPGVGGFCLRCHSPIAFVRGHTTPPDGSAFDDVDLQGIGCDTCHRAIPQAPPSAPYLKGDAQLFYSSSTDKHGPRADAVALVHGTTADPALSSSAFCGQCHSVTNPLRRLRDVAGNETMIDFPLDTTYDEWSHSDFAAAPGESCIDCHTRQRAGEWPLVSLPGAKKRLDPRDHVFAGGNLFGIRAVMQSSPERAAAFPNAFALALARTEQTLAAAVKIDIVTAPASAAPGGSFSVSLRVTNLSGHKFPTGYVEGRRAFVALVLVSPEGTETALVGGWDEANDEIVAPEKTHVYRAQHGHWNGTAAEPSEDIARHDMVLSDTRIPPKGFFPTLATMPAGEIDYGDGNGGFRHFDEATFDVEAPAGISGKAILSARVYYQPITRGYVKHLAEKNVTDASGQRLIEIFETLGGSPPTMIANAETTIDFGSGSGGGGGSGSGSGSSSGSSSGSGGGSASGSCDCSIGGTAGDSPARFGFFALVLLGRLRRKRRP